MFAYTTQHKGTIAFSIVLSLVLAFFAWPVSQVAHADELSQAQAELSEASSKLETITSEYEAIQSELDSLDSQVSEATEKVQDAQAAMLEGQEALSDTVVASYKSDESLSLLRIFLSSEDISDVARNLTYYTSIQEDQAELVEEQRALNEKFTKVLAELDEKRDAQEDKLNEAAAKKSEAEAVVAQAEANVSEIEEAQAELEALQAQAAQAQGWQVRSTDSSKGWKTGVASAYGTKSDGCLGAKTATGATVTESSMGVAVPKTLANYRSYYGHAVEIKYGSKTVVATVNDCGNFGKYGRVLDLQPGVCKALGYSSPTAWGSRTVSYRFL